MTAIETNVCFIIARFVKDTDFIDLFAFLNLVRRMPIGEPT